MTDELAMPPARSLAYVLRRRMRRDAATLIVGKVIAAPDSKHVTVQLAGVNVTVPRLASYTAPVADEACYLLSAGAVVIALGAVR